MAQTIEDIENRDGIRLTWNVWPVTQSKLEVVPIACMYNIAQLCMSLPCEPIYCHSCQAILCPQAILDYGALTWTCVCCEQRNTLPAYARDITPGNLLPEMMDDNCTVEYVHNITTKFAPVYFLIVDTCTYDAERHELMKNGLRHTLKALPDDVLIGVILYGTNVELISFGDSEIRTTYHFSGQIEYTKEDISKLGLSDIRSFLVTKNERGDELNKIIDSLEVDAFPVLSGFRPQRCTGAALSFAISFLEGGFSDSPVRYLLFTQGACTIGPGKVSMLEVAPTGTGRLDLEAAAQFYNNLGIRLSAAGHSVDVIAETIADIGVQQFRPIISMTGGTIIMAQDFEEEIKIGSLDKIFEKDENGVLRNYFNIKMHVKTSGNMRFAGVVGDGQPAGAGWRIGAANPSSNLTFLLENKTTARSGDFGYVQIISQFARSDRKVVTRVTTFGRMFSSDRRQIDSSFDQEASCVFQARALISRGFQNVLDFESAIDKNLIRFTKKYGSYENNNPASVFLPDSMSYYPNFMFFFRRSLLVQKDGISHDESAYFKLLVFRLKVSDAIKMIKPSLVSFHYQGDVSPVELDSASLDPEAILVLDSFHNVLLWKGAYVSNWIREGLHEKEEYSFFKTAISESFEYAYSLKNRLPVPQFKETCEGQSQARILLHYVNPSTHGVMATEKIDYNKFYDTLCRFIVKGD